MGQARETWKLIDVNWHATYKTQKLIAAKLNSFTVISINAPHIHITSYIQIYMYLHSDKINLQQG